MTTSPELLAAAAVAAESLMLAFAASLDTQDQEAINHVLQSGHLRLGLLYVPRGPTADPLVRMVLLDAAGVAAPLADLAFAKDTLQ